MQNKITYILVQLNAAGKAFFEQIDKWTTRKKFVPISAQMRKTFRAFHGDYVVRLLTGAKEVSRRTFHLSPGYSEDLTLDFNQ